MCHGTVYMTTSFIAVYTAGVGNMQNTESNMWNRRCRNLMWVYTMTSRLAYKLLWYGISGHSNGWIKDFFFGRTQCVVVDGCSSTVKKVLSGVPQGSVLGPCLFLFYINDIAQDLHLIVRLFADDTMIYLTVSNYRDAGLLQWADTWMMEFHQYHSENETHEVHTFNLWPGTKARWLVKVPRCDHHKWSLLGPTHRLYNIKGHKFIELSQTQYLSEQHKSETNYIQDAGTSSIGIQPDRLGPIHCSSYQEAWSCTTTSCQICHQQVHKNLRY